MPSGDLSFMLSSGEPAVAAKLWMWEINDSDRITTHGSFTGSGGIMLCNHLLYGR